VNDDNVNKMKNYNEMNEMMVRQDNRDVRMMIMTNRDLETTMNEIECDNTGENMVGNENDCEAMRIYGKTDSDSQI
jgi:hypothetical protein